jgi:murein DD-endopeptidase MepM/ murein hydrolase activator NlpD
MKKSTLVKVFALIHILPVILLIGLLSAPIHTVLAMPAGQEEGPTYIIQEGDTLNEIAIRFGVSMDDILSANQIENPNALFIGQRILIPGLEGITGTLTSEILPLGVSLIALARQNQVNQDDLVLLNRMTSPAEMIAGAAFIVPVNEGQDQLKPLPGMTIGESLLERAIRTGTSPWLLTRDNLVNASWEILAGETLYINVTSPLAESGADVLINVSATELPLIQGETLHITVVSPEPHDLSGRIKDEPLYFFSENEGVYHAFYGVHALAEPGVYPLHIEAEGVDGKTFSFDQLILLSPGFYGTQLVYVGPEFLDGGIIEEEDAYLASLLVSRTPDRLWEGRFQYPIDEPCVNSPFGLRRIYNDGLLFFYHTGVDCAVCAKNLNIYAPAAGEVIFAEELDIRGNAILIDHGWGVISGYWHLSEFNVSVGDFVRPGDLLGLIGNTGRSAGPHLHFEMLIHGIPVEPQTWLDQTFP